MLTPVHRRGDRPLRGITDEQRRSLGAIAWLTLSRGVEPKLGDIAEALHITRQSAADRLHWLAKKGLWQHGGREDGGAGLITAPGLLALGLPPPYSPPP